MLYRPPKNLITAVALSAVRVADHQNASRSRSGETGAPRPAGRRAANRPAGACPVPACTRRE